MHSFKKLIIGLVAVALWTGVPVQAKDAGATPDPKSSDKGKSDKEKKKDPKKKGDKRDDKKPDPKKKPDDANPPAAGADASNGPRLNLPLVKGYPSTKLTIPYKDEQGNLQMIYTIGTAVRVDDDNVEMKDVTVETYNNEGEPDMTVDLPVSKLNLNTKVVSSNTKTKITRSDMVVTGDSVEFNTVSKEAKLVGHVHVWVYDSNDNNEAKAPKPEPAETPDTPAKPNE